MCSGRSGGVGSRDGRCTVCGLGERGRAGTCCPSLPLSRVPAQGFELWECLPEKKKRGVKRCQREARSGKGEQQEQVVVSWELSEHRVLVKAVQFGDTGNTQPSPLGQHSGLWNEMAPVCEEKEWHCLAFPASLSSTQFLLHFKCVFFPQSSLFHCFVSLCVNPSPSCLQNSCAQTQQMLKGRTGTTLDAISILLKDH